MAPDISNSTVEERREYIKRTYPCIADCDMCGLCQVFHGKDAETAYDDYITGKRSFIDVSTDYRRWFGNKIKITSIVINDNIIYILLKSTRKRVV